MNTFSKNKQLFTKIAWATLILLSLWTLFATTRMFVFTNRTATLANNITAYEQRGIGTPTILVVGDSLAYGTGSSTSETTIAGYIGYHLPRASITNKAKNGTKTKTLLARISSDINKRYDVIIVIVGANDILHPEVSLNSSRKNLSKIYKFASNHANNVITVTTGDFNRITFFAYPVNYYFGNRSRQLSRYAHEESLKYANIHYINTHSNENNPKTPEVLEATDHLHLNDIGADYWASKILHETHSLEF